MDATKPKLDMNGIGARVRKIRKANKLTLRELAEKAGVSHTTINDIELARSASPGVEALYQISLALDVELEVVLGIAATGEDGIEGRADVIAREWLSLARPSTRELVREFLEFAKWRDGREDEQ